MGPEPSTTTVRPVRSPAFATACTGVARGSTRAASMSVMPSGTRWTRSAGMVNRSVMAPGVWQPKTFSSWQML